MIPVTNEQVGPKRPEQLPSTGDTKLADTQVENTPEDPKLVQVNSDLSQLLEGVRRNSDPETAWDDLAQRLEMLGKSFPLSEYSLRVTFSYDSLNETPRNIIEKWRLEAPISSVALAVPLRETTGTHGSQERQHLKDAVQTLRFDCDQGLIIIDVFGKMFGLPDKIRRNLEVSLPISSVTGIEIIHGTEWAKTLQTCIDGVVATRKTPLADWESKSIGALREQLAALS
jgi:hypothetical protein